MSLPWLPSLARHHARALQFRPLVAGARCRAALARLGEEGDARGRVQGKVALVTGGAQGIGRAICGALAGEGATVVVADVNGKGAREAASAIPRGWAVEVDVSDHEQVASMFREAGDALGRVDIVVNNAAVVSPQVPTAELSLDQYHAVIDVNLHGAFYVLRAALKQMTSQEPKGGVVLNMTSIVAHTAITGVAAYTAAKSALLGLTRSCAVEYASSGVRVVALTPCAVRTPMLEEWLETAPDMAEQHMRKPTAAAEAEAAIRNRFSWLLLSTRMNPIHGLPDPEDVAKAALYLCSDEARWVSGSALKVDGAYLAGGVDPHTRG